MTNIDPSKIKPVESRGIVYPDYDGDLCVGAVWLDNSDDYAILEHVPANSRELDWTEAKA